MKRIDHPSAITNSAGKKIFTAGDPQLGRPPTVLTADWATMLQEEVANVLELNGVQLDASDSRQLFHLLRRQERPPIGIGDFRPLPGAPEAAWVFLDFIESPVGVVCVNEIGGSVDLARGGTAEQVAGTARIHGGVDCERQQALCAAHATLCDHPECGARPLPAEEVSDAGLVLCRRFVPRGGRSAGVGKCRSSRTERVRCRSHCSIRITCF